MAKLYVFGIGGTGSRVLRSLTMMLAAGVDTNGYDIVPIVIDPDSSNYDLTLNFKLMKLYNDIYGKLNFSQSKNNFFHTPIRSDLVNNLFKIKNTSNKSFREFISLATMDKSTQAMTKLLFSDLNLNSSMDVGFRGNPNIGSVVLNQIVTPENGQDLNPVSEDFMKFANSFASGDKIFIISSIFGGTGASGFPLLLKSLRLNSNIPNQNLINNAEIGAITVLPYFKLKTKPGSEVNSDTFISKARAALGYYENNIVNDINALYFIADDVFNQYDHNEGGESQQDKAHLIEFFAATSIIDFAHKSFTNLSNFLELGVDDGHLSSDGSIRLVDLHRTLKSYLLKPLVKFTLTANLFKNERSKISGTSLDINNKLFNNVENYYNSTFVQDFTDFLDAYLLWLEEMAANNRHLDLFKLNSKDKPFNLINGIEPKADSFYKLKRNYSLYLDYLNNVKVSDGISENDRLMELHYLATENIIKDKFNSI